MLNTLEGTLSSMESRGNPGNFLSPTSTTNYLNPEIPVGTRAEEPSNNTRDNPSHTSPIYHDYDYNYNYDYNKEHTRGNQDQGTMGEEYIYSESERASSSFCSPRTYRDTGADCGYRDPAVVEGERGDLSENSYIRTLTQMHEYLNVSQGGSQVIDPDSYSDSLLNSPHNTLQFGMLYYIEIIYILYIYIIYI